MAALVTLLPLLVGYLLDSPMGRTVGRLDRAGGRGHAQDNLGWLETKETLGRAYRMEAVARSLAGLWDFNRCWAFAVWYTYVDPWDRFDPERREEWANEGLCWMADEIPGELWAFGDKRTAAAHLRQQGMKRDEVAGRLHMSNRDIPAKERDDG